MKSGSREQVRDAELVQGAQRGDKRAFVEIVARHQAAVCGICFSILNDFAGSEDAAQEAFLTAWRKIRDVREPEHLRGWLMQIARNAALAQIRCKREEEPLDEIEAFTDEAPRPDEALVSDEEAALVRKSLEKLPEVYRLPLVLFYREGKSVRAVAESLGISEDAVKQRLARGRGMMRDRMENVLDRVMTGAGPTAIFTMSVAAAIGALAAPATVAATAFGTAASASSTVASTSVFTAMSTTKGLVVTGAFVAALCIPAGYQIAKVEDDVLVRSPKLEAVAPLARVSATSKSFVGTALFAEWRALHEQHGTNAAAMPVLFDAIEQLKDPLRKRMFHAALASEWAEIDPSGGLAFFLKKKPNGGQASQLFTDWLKVDPNSAIDTALSIRGPDSIVAESVLRETLKSIAQVAPSRVPEIVERLPKPEDFWDTSVIEAFATMAANDLDDARETAEKLKGGNREAALRGVAKAWAKSDAEKAISWVKALPGDVDRDEILRNALIGLASTDPASALNQLSLVPSGGRSHYFASTTCARVLSEGAKHDFEGTVAWLSANRGRVTSEDTMGMVEAVSERLNSNLTEFLDRHANNGTLAALVPAIDNALLNLAGGIRSVMWDWLKTQPANEETRLLKESVVRSAAWQDKELALRLASELPSTPDGEEHLRKVAQSLINDDWSVRDFDRIYAAAPDRLRPGLLQQAFDRLGPESVGDVSIWIERAGKLPEAERPAAIEKVAREWARKTPEEAAQWARSFTDEETRERTVGAVAGAWIEQDERSAADWINSLPPGGDRDRSALELVYRLATKYPQEARQWTLSIQDELQRTRASFFAVQNIALKNPALAQEWIETVPARAESKDKMRELVQKISKK